jgi:myo-inositol-1(or 4)-monophosphatase
MDSDLKLVKDIVITAAKQVLLPRFKHVARKYKPDGTIVTEADIIMQDKLSQALQAIYPDIAFMGEEMSTEQQQALLSSNQAVWCVDPIDGTTNFAAGLPYFCVSIALIVASEVTFGLVYDPIHDEYFSAQRGQGAYFNNSPIRSVTTGLKLFQTVAFIDYKRLTKDLAQQLVKDKPYGSQRSLGTVALELCWLAIGRGHLYLHGKQQLWDYAAAQLILAESGIPASTLAGEPVFDNSLATRSTVAATDSSLFNDWYHYLTTCYD